MHTGIQKPCQSFWQEKKTLSFAGVKYYLNFYPQTSASSTQLLIQSLLSKDMLLSVSVIPQSKKKVPLHWNSHEQEKL